MNLERKGQSPFYPGQPVPVELFVGRAREIARIRRAAVQVAGGKPQSTFICGEYGIGKSSLARYMRAVTEEDPGLLGFHVMLGASDSLNDLAAATVHTMASSNAAKPKATETIRKILSDYIGEISLLGVITLKLDKLRKDAPDISREYLPFLHKVYDQIKGEYQGIMLILDEINGIVGKPVFAQFLKNLVDENALSNRPLPLLLALCGTEERYKEIVDRHRPVERIFDIARIDPMNEAEMKEFFNLTFGKAGMKVDDEAMYYLCLFSGGLPKLMHLVGDSAFWIAQEDVIDKDTAFDAIIAAAEDVGRKYVDQQVYKALRSKDYKRILSKLAKHDFDLSFKKNEVVKGLNEDEKRKFNNFLQKMKKLGVLNSGEERGEYIFRDRLTRLYIRMETISRRGG